METDWKDRYRSDKAKLATRDIPGAIENALRGANYYLRHRCRLLELDPDSKEAAPVLWWLTNAEMEAIKDGLTGATDAVSVVLREQMEALLESVRLMKEGTSPETGP